MTPTGPVIFASDGSSHARAAIERAGAPAPTGRAVVVTAWSTLAAAAPGALLALPGGVITAAVADIDTATREAAELTVAEGVQLAAAAGFDAELWPRMCARNRHLDRLERKAGRELPLVRLVSR